MMAQGFLDSEAQPQVIKIGLDQYLYAYIELDRPSRESINDTLTHNYDLDIRVWNIYAEVYYWRKEYHIDELFSSHITKSYDNPRRTTFDIDELRDIKMACQEKMKVEESDHLRKVYEGTFSILDKLDKYYEEGKVTDFAYETSY